MYQGVAASPGIAVGKAFLYQKQEMRINYQSITVCEVEAEIEKYRLTLRKAEQQLRDLIAEVTQKIGTKNAEIFEAHIMILQDQVFTDKVETLIKEHLVTADNAVEQAVSEIVAVFEKLDDEYMRARAADIRDVGLRLLTDLLNIPPQTLQGLREGVILVAKDLTPSDTAQMDKDKILGIATEMGGRTSHTAIMARSLEIPAVVGLQNITEMITGEDITVIIDGNEGIVELDPDEKTLEVYQDKNRKYRKEAEELKKMRHLPGQTKDGCYVELSANIGTPQDVTKALAYGAEGIGLYRTEFLYMDRTEMPDEEEQFAAYKQVAEKMAGKPVIIRTLDIGGDKKLPYLPLNEEMNPFLGVRAIRLCLIQQEMFKTQLRAILRASRYGKIKIMYPMIATLEELQEANQILGQVKEELDEQKVEYDQDIEVGIMVEIPSTAINAGIFAQEVDFFSIGSNDLIQYTMAADRLNENLAYLYDPYNPAILQLIKNVIDESHQAGKWTGMCGELAGEPRAALILLGMGLDEFSMSAGSIPKVKKIIRAVSKTYAQEIAQRVLKMKSSRQITAFLDEELGKIS